MTEQEKAVLMIKGALTMAPPETQEKVKLITERLRSVLDEGGQEAVIAMAMLIPEYQDKL